MASGTLDKPVVVPARTGRAFQVASGQRIAVIDLEGSQVVDLFAFVAGAHHEHLSASHTRATRERLLPAIGEAFVTNRRRPILTFLEDTSPGIHDMLIAACDPTRYELLGSPGHANCQENLEQALGDHGIELGFVPQPLNLFMNIPTDEDGRVRFLPSPSKPGDRVVLRAEVDVLVAISVCPQDLVPINNGLPTAVGIAVLD